MMIVSFSMYWKDFEIRDGIITLYRGDGEERVEVGYCLQEDLEKIEPGIFRLRPDKLYDELAAAHSRRSQLSRKAGNYPH